MENKKENIKKKTLFVEDVKLPSEAGMMCTINGDTFLFTKNIWIGDFGVSCHIMNNHTSLFDIIDIKEFIQGSFSIMPPMKKNKLHINI